MPLCDFSAALSVPTLGELKNIATFIAPGPLDVNVFGTRRQAMAWLQQPTR